ncbi:hypothetical protein HJG60_010438 [Phyllostomus discolor]|uniref:Uncharacterized protein n=1 Tax=Phyllostomus discolor TaxID=89673 RepID=A0A834AN48_9CHIR|nr:hypothetical protein HJG60_010438 [Phyllostomus discolor]
MRFTWYAPRRGNISLSRFTLLMWVKGPHLNGRSKMIRLFLSPHSVPSELFLILYISNCWTGLEKALETSVCVCVCVCVCEHFPKGIQLYTVPSQPRTIIECLTADYRCDIFREICPHVLEGANRVQGSARNQCKPLPARDLRGGCL